MEPTFGQSSTDLHLQVDEGQATHAPELFVSIGCDATFKIGTCQHCVYEEVGRPDRAWDADEDRELDFDRDTYFAHLATYGITIHERQAYVCP